MPSPSNWPDSLNQSLSALKEKNLYRSLTPVDEPAGRYIRFNNENHLNFSSNNYLGLAGHPHVKKAASEAALKWGGGSGASRLVCGDLKIHTELEHKIALFKKEEAALVFSSGYLANLGAVTAMVHDKDLVLVDRLNHASLIDAARLSGAKLWVYPHKDVSALDRLLKRASGFDKKLVVTDAYFSMDGDVAPLDRLVEVCERHKAILMIDEAHSSGVFGKTGSGLAEYFGLSGQIPIVMGTLSKALGSVGGFIGGKGVFRDYLINFAREFIYTTAPAPAASGAAIAALELIRSSPDLRKSYWNNIYFVREALVDLGFDLMDSEGPIIPIVIGDTKKTIAMKDFLRKARVMVPAIRPPTVPKGTDRIRISMTAEHTRTDLEILIMTLKKAKEKIL